MVENWSLATVIAIVLAIVLLAKKSIIPSRDMSTNLIIRMSIVANYWMLVSILAIILMYALWICARSYATL